MSGRADISSWPLRIHTGRGLTLLADSQQVPEPLGRQQGTSLSLTLEQRVRCDCRSHTDAFYLVERDLVLPRQLGVRADLDAPPDTLGGGILVVGRVDG